MMVNAWTPSAAVAVLGGSLRHTEHQIRAGFAIGFELAKRKRTVVTGATSGVPYAAALGAHAAGGLVVGISPATSAEEHIRSGRPRFQADVLLYTGMGAEGRSPLILRSVSGAIFVGGEFGTLGEFCSGWLSGCAVLGVLEQHGGMADAIRSLAEQASSSWGSEMIYGGDAAQLAADVSDRIELLPELPDPAGLGQDVRRIVEPLLERSDVKAG